MYAIRSYYAYGQNGLKDKVVTETTTTATFLSPVAVALGAANPVNTGSTGSGQAHNNLQPYITLNYIIYTGV